MVIRIELDDKNIGWTQYGPSEYIPERMKQWLIKYVWNRDELSKYERVESLYIVGPSKTGKTDTCFNLLNKDGEYCKVFVIDTYTNWRAFHDYIGKNGLPDFVLVDDISIEELGREWKNLLGAQKTITYALTSTNKVTIEYGRPCIYLCNPDSDIFTNNSFKSSKRLWLEDNLFGGEPIYLKKNFINGMDVKKYNRFAGDIKCKNIDPEIKKYIGFEDNEFESFPQPVQEKFLNKAIEEYINELNNRKLNVDYSELDKNSSIYRSFGNNSIYCSGVGGLYGNSSVYDSAICGGSLENNSVYYDATNAADVYIKWYKSAY
jgi:hypothetical protein